LHRGPERTIELFEGQEETIQTSALYIANIYTGEIFAVDSGRYTAVMNVTMSDTKEYLAFWGSYVDRQGIAVTELVTIHIASNDIVSHYEQQDVDNFYIDSFHWLPNNILGVNFINLVDLNRDAFRLHRIAHSFRTNVFQEPQPNTDIPDLEEDSE
jgi:hypothetical protein